MDYKRRRILCDNKLEFIFKNNFQLIFFLNQKALRSIFYDSADAIILIFSLVQKVTYENITSIWAKEVGQYVAEVPIFLVGTDLEQW